MEGVDIYKFAFLMNEKVAVASLAPTYEIALERCMGLFGKDEKYELVSKKFSHNSASYSLSAHKQIKKSQVPTATVSQDEKEVDLMDNVMGAYAKDKKVFI